MFVDCSEISIIVRAFCPPNLHFPLSKVSFPSNSSFHVISQYKPYLQLYSLLLHRFFNLGFMYTHVMPILINQRSLHGIFIVRKALNGQNSLKENFHSSTFQCYLQKLASLNNCFPLFPTLFLFQIL